VISPFFSAAAWLEAFPVFPLFPLLGRIIGGGLRFFLIPFARPIDAGSAFFLVPYPSGTLFFNRWSIPFVSPLL